MIHAKRFVYLAAAFFVFATFGGIYLIIYMKDKIENHRVAAYPYGIVDIYDDPDGLHFTLKVSEVKYSDLLVELKDEQSEYNFDYRGVNYNVLYFRTGSAATGCTGVYVVLNGQLYSINSHFLHKKK